MSEILWEPIEDVQGLDASWEEERAKSLQILAGARDKAQQNPKLKSVVLALNEQIDNFPEERFQFNKEVFEEGGRIDGKRVSTVQDAKVGGMEAHQKAPDEDEWIPLKSDEEVLANLPDSIMKDEVMAAVVGFGGAMSWVARGVEQIGLGITDRAIEEQYKNDEIDEEDYLRVKQQIGMDERSLQAEARFMTELYDSSVGNYALGGNIAGSLVEPVGFLLPGMKAANMTKAVVKASATGGGYMGLGYVDEERGESRTTNVGLGMTLGGGIGYGYKKISNVVESRMVSNAEKVLDDMEIHVSEQVLMGKSRAQIQGELRMVNPNSPRLLQEATDLTGRVPSLPITKKMAQETLDYHNPASPDVKAGGMVENLLGVFTTRIGNMDKGLLGVVRKNDFNSLIKTHNDLKRVDPWMKSVDEGIPKNHPDRITLEQALMKGDFEIVEAILKRNGGDKMVREFGEVRKVLDEYAVEYQGADRAFKAIGLEKGDKLKFFPRHVSDYKGLQKQLGTKKAKALDKAVDEADIKSIKSKGRRLSTAERASVVNKALKGFPRKGYKAGHTKRRQFDEIDEEWLPYYSDPFSSLTTYISNARHDLEKLRFFGKNHTVLKTVDGKKQFDLTESVGSYVDTIRHKLSPAQQEELKYLLETRFGIGEMAPNKWVRRAKNVMYAGLLGNPISAATQLGDIGVAIYINGFRNTIKGLASRKVDMEDFGLADTIVEEFRSVGSTAKFLNGSLKYSGFRTIDRLGKNTLLNSSLRNWTQKVRTDKGLKEFSTKYKQVLGKEYEQTVLDLKSGTVTDNVKLMLFNELADIQPISLSEMPAAYLAHPNGRVFYMLKSFMIKQLDLIRREGLTKLNTKGQRAQGAYNLTKYAAILGSANAGSSYIKDMMMGKEVEPEAMDIATNFFKMFAMSEYLVNKMADGEVLEAGGSILLPPFGMFEEFLRAGLKEFEAEEDKDLFEDPNTEWTRYMPIFGRMYYMWFGGGIEKAAEKRDNEEWEAMDE